MSLHTLHPASEATRTPAATQNLAAIIDDSFPLFLLAAQGRGLLSDAPVEAFVQFAESAVADICGDAYQDRMLRYLVQQFLIGHYTVLRLHAEGAGCTDPDLRRANHGTATKLATELRRLSREIDDRVRSSQHSTRTAGKTAQRNKLESKRTA